MPHNTTREEIYRVTSEYLEQGGLSWKNCISICTDGAAAMTGNVKGFISRIKAQNQNVRTTHCFLHREALVAKTLPKDLSDVLDGAVDIVNFIKARPLKSRLFSIMRGNGSRAKLVAAHCCPLALTRKGLGPTVRVKRRTQSVPIGRELQMHNGARNSHTWPISLSTSMNLILKCKVKRKIF